MGKNTSNPKMKNLKPLKELFSSYYKNFLKIFLSLNMSCFCLKRFSQKIFLPASLMRNEFSLLIFPEYNMSLILVISLIYCVKKKFRQVLGSPSIWKNRYKIYETGLLINFLLRVYLTII